MPPPTLVNSTMRASPSTLMMPPGGKAPVTAVEWALRAAKMLRGLNTSSPGLGDDARPETRPEMKALLARIKRQLNKLGKGTTHSMDDVILNRLAEEPADGDGDKDGAKKKDGSK